jgi:hypothetical protein
LALHRFRGRLLTLAIAEPVFGFLDLAVDLALFEHASGDGHQIGCGHNLVGRFGQEFWVTVAGQPVSCRWSALGWQRARNRRQAIAFEALHFRGGHSQVAARRGFRCNGAVFAQDADCRKGSAKLARNLASRIKKGSHTCQTLRKFGPLFNVLMVFRVVFGMVFAFSARF